MPAPTYKNSSLPPETLDHKNNNKVMLMNNETNKNKRWNEFETEIKWKKAAILLALHCGCLYTLVTFPYRQQSFLIMWTFFTIYIAAFGITAGVHRFWTHRSYKAKIPLRLILAIFYYSAGMDTIYGWVRDHRIHHKYTDTEADPHNTNRGFWFSHVGWVIMKKKLIVQQRRKEVDMTDILNDPVVQFFDGNYIILNTLFTFVMPIFVPVYFLNQDLKWTVMSQLFLRYPYILNLAWCVNSFGHMIGYRPYDKSIQSTDNILIAITTYGEGWHNYHHVFPWDYKAAELKSFIFNTTTFWIDLFAKIGWAYDLKHATAEHVQKVVETKGDGSQLRYAKL
ncbi:hypothetical protein PV325_009267 [Microctonus aethiopoides]|nr:hypothetical protein PV325_009267 [Microctonus aethiopoides]KAK0092092.1 hypothetical protein PV326_002214 [Microctonus aethiopoides]